jgi:hypothetical protein
MWIMILGIDLDNTLVCYDGLFHAAAVAEGFMPPDGPRNKREVRSWFVDRNREDDFTWLQGRVYGSDLALAKPYPGALACIANLIRAGVEVHVISHKTRFPVLGPRHDLHRASWSWLDENGFRSAGLLSSDHIHLEETMERKARRVAETGCSHFVDDLSAFFRHPAFPSAVNKILFAPEGESPENAASNNVMPIESWFAIEKWIFSGSPAGTKHGHVRNAPKPGDVLERMVRGAERGIPQPRPDSDHRQRKVSYRLG